jgi:hypothetical protein
VKCFLIRYLSYTQTVIAQCKKPTAQTAHLVFANTKANAEKTKRAVSCQRSTENKMKK